MRKTTAAVIFGLSVLLLSGCYDFAIDDFGNTGGSIWFGGTPQFATTGVTVSAGMTELQPATVDTLSSTVNASRFGVTTFDRVYELETPANTDFSFNVVARGENNFGLTRIDLGHVDDNGLAPSIGVESIASVGMTLEAPGLSNQGEVLHVNGDGFARVTVRGQISTDQVLLARVPFWNGDLDIGIRLKVGVSTEINLSAANPQGFRPGMTSTDVFSSDAWQFGLPAIAVSGDRFSVVSYDGDPNTNQYVVRRRRWLQMDAATSTVTGGDSECYSPDSGFWRDQEIAALGNVLAVAYTGNGELRAEVSLDRGASFPIETLIEPSVGFGTRLVQVAMADDYTLGVLYWKSDYYGARLLLAEATPSGFNANNDPIGYIWGTPAVVHNAGQDVTPLVMHMEYSSGGDLVIGYGYTFTNPGMASARYRCAVRMWGSSAFFDKEIDRQDFVMPCDPHVSVLGSGSTMEIFYTYERNDGVYLWYSNNAGVTYSLAEHVQHPGAMMPSVHVRMQGTQKRVDLLYVAPDGWGFELHNKQWDDFTLSATPSEWRVTQATATVGGNPPPGMPQGWLITTLAWFGYDAVIKGDDVAVVLHETTYDSYDYYRAAGWQWQQPNVGGGWAAAGGGGGSGGGGYTPPPTPQILLPGMGGSVPTPDPAHRNQLKIVVLD